MVTICVLSRLIFLLIRRYGGTNNSAFQGVQRLETSKTGHYSGHIAATLAALSSFCFLNYLPESESPKLRQLLANHPTEKLKSGDALAEPRLKTLGNS